MNSDPVRDYYARFDEREWDRLQTPEGRVEFTLTKMLLHPHLPDHGRVLDIGGGPGRYADWLAGRGLDVSLADLSPNLLAIARSRLPRGAVREIIEADVRDLSRWDPNEFAAALCLGPFYHLVTGEDRTAALAELLRVVRPGGLIAIALMPKYGYLRRTLSMADERRHLADAQFVQRLVDEGVFFNDIPGRFTQGFGVDPTDIAGPFEAAGLTSICVASTHGFATGLEDELDSLRSEDPGTYQQMVDLLVRTASDPSLLGTAGHLLYLGRRPSPNVEA